MTKEEAIKIFESTGALLNGHFMLTSGLHSPQYFQCAKVLQYPRYTELLCNEIVKNVKDERIDCVISPAIGGVVVGQECGRLLKCRAIFAERENGVMTLRRGFEIRHDERVLVVEDVVTTGGSVKEVVGLVKSVGAEVAGVGFIVDRSNGKKLFEEPSYSVFQMDVVTYKPDKCPLCKEGLQLVKPGSRNLK
jgi:orotate phosphoribosyltransferase